MRTLNSWCHRSLFSICTLTTDKVGFSSLGTNREQRERRREARMMRIRLMGRIVTKRNDVARRDVPKTTHPATRPGPGAPGKSRARQLSDLRRTQPAKTTLFAGGNGAT